MKLIHALLLAASLLVLAAVPTSTAEAAPVIPWHCGADVYFEGAHYDCKVYGAGADGNVIWCPQYMCVSWRIVSCWADPYGISCW